MSSLANSIASLPIDCVTRSQCGENLTAAIRATSDGFGMCLLW